ncbi:MAG: hypothetical protein IJ392_06745 [Clostridia bacterium]|nr:hypothetical protein [Clostridia bacterium]
MEKTLPFSEQKVFIFILLLSLKKDAAGSDPNLTLNATQALPAITGRRAA